MPWFQPWLKSLEAALPITQINKCTNTHQLHHSPTLNKIAGLNLNLYRIKGIRGEDTIEE
uniref:Ethylene-responsive transcription factor ERF114 n=1 Tax=Rhizophora mucronata TaxID=61149 RepID=A0A2P2P2N0_RHIMU